MKKPRKNNRKLDTKKTTHPSSKQDTDEATLAAFEKRIAAGKKLTSAELKTYYELQKRSNPEAIGSVQEAAKYSGMSARVIRYANGKGELRANPDGTFDKVELDRWINSRDGRKQPVADAEMSQREKKGNAHYWEFKGKKEELLYRNTKELLVGWPDVEKEWDARLIELTSSLDNLADRASGLVVGKSRDEVREIIRAEVRMFRDNYARLGKYTPEVK